MAYWPEAFGKHCINSIIHVLPFHEFRDEISPPAVRDSTATRDPPATRNQPAARDMATARDVIELVVTGCSPYSQTKNARKEQSKRTDLFTIQANGRQQNC